MDARPHDQRSHLFTIRLWPAEPGAGSEPGGWRAEVKDVSSGERRYCRDWQTLVDYLQALLSSHTDGHTL